MIEFDTPWLPDILNRADGYDTAMTAYPKVSPRRTRFRSPETFAKPYSGRRKPPSGRRGPQGVFGRSRSLHGRVFRGRSIRQEQPAYGGGVLATLTTYDDLGRVASTQTFHELNAVSTPVSAATLYTYDSLGEPVLSGLDLNGNGVLDLATDRVSGQTNTVVQIGADYWRESTSWTYPNQNSAVPVTTGTSRSRLTGLGAAAPAPYSGVLTSESVSIDLLGNQSRRLTYTDAANQTTWSVTDTPDSTLDAVTKSVGGVTVESTSPVGEVTTYAYDDLRRPILTSVLRPLTSALTSTNHYNALGQVDYVEEGNGGGEMGAGLK